MHDISFKPPVINEKLISLEGRFRKGKEHNRIEKSIGKNERLISFDLISRTTKKLERLVTFTWPQEDKI